MEIPRKDMTKKYTGVSLYEIFSGGNFCIERDSFVVEFSMYDIFIRLVVSCQLIIVSTLIFLKRLGSNYAKLISLIRYVQLIVA